MHLCTLRAELLSHVIREISDIKGIKVHNKEVKLSLCADDTTIISKADKDSLSGVMRVLDWFRNSIGLGIDKKRPRLLKLEV